MQMIIVKTIHIGCDWRCEVLAQRVGADRGFARGKRVGRERHVSFSC